MSEEHLGDELKDKASEAAEKAKEVVSEVADDVKEGAKKAADAAKEAASDIKEEWDKMKNNGENKRMLAGLLAIFLGALGVHKFVLGYQKEGIIMLVLGILGWALCGIALMVVWVIGVVEGIIYLSKTNIEFYNTYQAGKKAWF